MVLQKFILNICLKVVDLCTFWIHPTKGKVTFISMTSDKLNNDFALIDAELKKSGKYEVSYDLMKFKKNLWGDFLYFLNCLRQLVEIKRSQLVIINDNNYVLSTFKPAHTKVLQVWHAAGAVKKFGNQIDRKYEVGGYDSILCSSPYWKKCYSEAFGVPESRIVDTGTCRVDDLLNSGAMKKKVERFYRKYPQLEGKKIALYAPTFRGNIIDGMYSVDFDGNAVAKALGPDYVVVNKFHPLLRADIKTGPANLDLSKEDLYTLMKVSDVMISDYSSIIFDYALLDKPQISFVPDLVVYRAEIGLNIPYEDDFPGAICETEAEVAAAIRDLPNYDHEKLARFRHKYICHDDGKNTKRVMKLIDEMTGA